MAIKPPNRMDAGFPGGVTPRFLIIELPATFPDPLRDLAAFREAVELLAYMAAGASARGSGDDLKVGVSYRRQGDSIADALIAEQIRERRAAH